MLKNILSLICNSLRIARNRLARHATSPVNKQQPPAIPASCLRYLYSSPFKIRFLSSLIRPSPSGRRPSCLILKCDDYTFHLTLRLCSRTTEKRVIFPTLMTCHRSAELRLLFILTPIAFREYDNDLHDERRRPCCGSGMARDKPEGLNS
ncbi:hypothetical protein SAMN05421754_1001220 [Nitrosomonas sp. Nm58]|nr:hypothetical protein SAMN05421754_1001220 [Nitrosomonas sp. Nm58]